MDFNDVQHGEEMEMSPASSPPQPQQPVFIDAAASSRSKMGPTNGGGGEGSSGARKRGSSTAIRYRECLKNHAVNISGHALDGCGEFLAAGEEGTLDALKCAACGCHRNFHRKEPAADTVAHKNSNNNVFNQHPVSAFYRHPAAYPPPPPSGYLHLTHQGQQRPLALTAAAEAWSGGSHSREEGEDYVSNRSSSGGGSGSGMLSKKRFRTKFTAEQKEKMIEFAEKVGWQIQKHDEAAVEEFCVQTGVKRQVLKVWMHNNKHTIGRKP